MRRFFLCALAVCLVRSGLGQGWREGFENGPGSARPYEDSPGGTTVEVVAGGAAEGNQFLRAVLPGKKPLEGVNVTASGLRGGRVATVTAQVRGKGRLWLCLISRNGWLYSPETVLLTDRWQPVSLRKVLVRADTALGIHFLSHPESPREAAVYEVDDVSVSLGPPPRVYDAEAGPWRFEAEDFAQRRDWVAPDGEASGGQVVRRQRYLALAGLPFPRTERPVFVHVRVRSASPGETCRLETRQAGQTEVLCTARPSRAGTWEWVAFPPVTAGEAGDSFAVALQGDGESAAAAAFDQVVLGTAPGMSPEVLASAPVWGSRRPLVTVPRTGTPPTLDGRGDDPCWGNAPACSGFLGLTSLAPAEAETSVRLCRDATHLYVLATCREPILNAAQQRRGEFRAQIAARDAEVYQDDSMVFLFDPADNGRQAYEVTVNALGTLADARCAGPDLWGTRDLQWNAATQAAGHIGEDLWAVELAIPFADLGGAPAPGAVWQAGFGRIARARQEVTSWHPCRKGFHDPYQFGTLVFEDPAAGGIELAVPRDLQPGRNVLTASLTATAGESRGVFLCAAWGAAADRPRSRVYGFADLGAGLSAAELPFTLGNEGDAVLECGALDAATLRPLVLTPLLPRRVKSSQAAVALACDGPYELFLNGDLLSRGDTAPVEPIAAPLARGANVFALRLVRGTGAVAVEASGVRFTGETWKEAPADNPDAAKTDLDDASWPPPARVGEHPRLGPVVGRPGAPVTLRRTLLWEKTRIWPAPVPAFYLARGPAQHFSVIADGLRGRRLTDWTVTLAVPPHLEVLGSSGFYGTTSPGQPRFVCSQAGIQPVNGRPMRVAKVSADKPVLAGRHYIMSLFDVFLRVSSEAGEDSPEEDEILYWAEGNGGSVSEPPQRFRVRLLPRLAGRQPKELVFQLWGGWFSNLDDPDMRLEILRCARAAGFNDLVAGDRWTGEHAPSYGLAVTLTTSFQPWELNLAPHLEQHPEQRLLANDGKPSARLMCTSVLLGEGWPAVDAALAVRLEAVRPATVDIDYEYGPFAGPHSCYCPRCLEAFREFARVAPGTALDPAVIRQAYAAAWVDFMARRTARVFAAFREAVHRLAPGTRFTVYSGYQTPANPEVYGVDWRYVGELRACDAAGAGYGEAEPVIARTVEALRGIPLRAGLLVTPYQTEVLTPLVPLTKAGILRHLLAATGGVLVYDRQSFDGRVWYAVAEVSRLAAEFEEVFLRGKPAQVLPGFEVTQAQVLSEGGTTLVCVMNPGSTSAEYTIPLPVEAGAGEEFYSRRPAAAGESVRCRLEPGDAAVFVLRQGAAPTRGR